MNNERSLAKEITEGFKALKSMRTNEPVAWMLADKEAEHIRSIMAVQHDFVPEGCVEIPLYTHPADTISYKDLHQMVKNVLAHPVEEHFEDEPQAEELHEIMQSNTHPVEEQDESFDRTASHMAGEYVSWTSCVACGQRVKDDSIHTCSPQLKQLTDEEIISEWVGCERNYYNFARAIMKRCGIISGTDK